MRRGLFETDVLISEVWGAAQRRSGPLSSEKRLMVAVLHDAFDCYQKYIFADDRVGRALFAEAAAWLNSTSADGLFSFMSISETLDIEPEYFRRGLAAWHKRRVEIETGGRPAAPTDKTGSDASPGDPTPARAARR
jgi:hypothetical protein